MNLEYRSSSQRLRLGLEQSFWLDVGVVSLSLSLSRLHTVSSIELYTRCQIRY